VLIPALTPPETTAVLIRNALDADLPPDYSVFVPAGAPNRVQIFRADGDFSLSVTDDVPDQVIEIYTVPMPILGRPATALLGVMLAGAGVWLGWSRRRAFARR
jgi:hypothetical protein